MLIVNPSSGGERSKEFEEMVIEKLNKFFDKVDVLYTKGEGDARTFSRKACKEEYHSVFAMGGDGTVNEAISGIAEQDCTPNFGFFPLGTVNDLARALNISMNPVEAIENFSIDNLTDLDIGKINDIYFINVVAVGILPESINDVESEDKTKMGKFAYYLSVIKNLVNLESFKFRVVIDGKEEEMETSTILIGLTNSVGGFETLFPEAKVNDGFLNFLAIKDKNIFDTVMSVPDIMSGIKNSTETVEYRRFKTARIEQVDNTKILTVNIDGDKGPQLPIDISILPRHIKVYCCN